MPHSGVADEEEVVETYGKIVEIVEKEHVLS